MNLQEMDAVSFAVKCSDACLTTQQNTFLTQFYPFLAKFVKENIRFVFNLNEGGSLLVVSVMRRRVKLPCPMGSSGPERNSRIQKLLTI